MANPVHCGMYTTRLPSNGGCITYPGEGRNLELLPPNALGIYAHKINVAYKPEKGAYALQFAESGKYLTWVDEPAMNNKLVTDDKPRYSRLTEHEYVKSNISAAEDKQYHLGPALERMYPSWLALLSTLEEDSNLSKRPKYM